ncbi:hypothetical protein D3C87_1809380 [compost metagenome]
MCSRAAMRRSACPIRQAVGWLTPRASARRTEDKPLSDCSISHMPFSQTLRGSFVECSGVCVVTVNWKRHSPLEH